MLEIEDLSVSYGAIKALDHVSIGTEKGKITAVLGANGAGKTTMLRAITGLVKPLSGRVRFDGVDLIGRPVEEIARLGVSHVPEGRGVIEELTVAENLRLGTLWGIRRSERAAAIEEVYALFPILKEFHARHGSELSGGQRQMLAVGRALVSRPRLLLLDEPSLGLAPLVTAELMAALVGLVTSHALTMVLVEQNARSALSIANDAVVVNLGKIVRSDSAEAIGSDEELRQAYLGF